MLSISKLVLIAFLVVYYYYYYIRLTAFFPGQPGKQAPER